MMTVMMMMQTVVMKMKRVVRRMLTLESVKYLMQMMKVAPRNRYSQNGWVLFIIMVWLHVEHCEFRTDVSYSLNLINSLNVSYSLNLINSLNMHHCYCYDCLLTFSTVQSWKNSREYSSVYRDPSICLSIFVCSCVSCSVSLSLFQPPPKKTASCALVISGNIIISIINEINMLLWLLMYHHHYSHLLLTPKGGRGCLMFRSCLESQGCHLIPLSHLLFFPA